MKLYHATDIVWDVDDVNPDGRDELAETLGLPSSTFVYAEDEDAIADQLSDRYGWCILSLNMEEWHLPCVLTEA